MTIKHYKRRGAAADSGSEVAGADTEIQFNDSGAFGASANLTWDDDTLYIKCGSTTEPHLHLDGGYNTDRPYIRLNNSLDSETKILQSWNSETNINLKVYYEVEHAHNLSDERFNIACKGNGVSSSGNRLSLFENSSSQTYNVTTGAGMERILTASDLGFATNTTTNLADISHAVNTSATKVAGYTIFNTTTNKPVWAVGSADGDVWVDATGATAHTPV